MNNKYIVYGIFGALVIIMLSIVSFNTQCIKSDIYDLLNLQVKQQEREVIEAIEKNISHNVYFLSKDFDNLEYFKNLNQSFKIFKEINIAVEQNIDLTKELNLLKIATLNRETLELLRSNKKDFFVNSINDLFGGFNVNLLGNSNDLLNLSSHSTILNTNQNIRLDISTMRLYTIFEDEIYYVGSATLDEMYDSNLLLEYVKVAKDYATKNHSVLLVNSSALFAAEAKNEGNKEAIFMGSISLVLLIIFLLTVFKNIHIFKLIFIVVFSFICGICGAILLLKNVHLLSIVISTSLVGLILDFAMHYLSVNQSIKIHKISMKDMRKVFLIALFITSSGYLIFLISPMEFLHQIAIISVCSLCGAFFSTYFLLPYLLENNVFSNTNLFNKTLSKICAFAELILRFKLVLIVAICVLLVMGILSFKPEKISDNIKHYSSLPKHLMAESTLFSRILQSQVGTQFVLLDLIDLDNESALIAKLKDQHLITDYYGLSSMLLSQNEQQEVKRILIDSLNEKEISGLYKQMGFTQNDLLKITKNIQDTPIVSIDEALQIPLLQQLNVLVYNQQNAIIFLNNSTKNKTFFDILDSHHAVFIDFITTINNSFMEIKQHAIILKIFAFVFAFVSLVLFFGIKRGSVMVALVLLSTLLSVALLLVFGEIINIFVIFGLIVASAIGVDYMLFATNQTLNLKQKIQSIVLASVTSVISFVLLMFSATQAVFSFGLAVSLGIGLAAIFAIMLAISYCKE